MCYVFVCVRVLFVFEAFWNQKKGAQNKKTVNPKQAQTEKKKVYNTKTESTCTFA